LKEFIEIWHRCYVARHYSKFVLYKSSYSGMQQWRMPKLTRWDDDDAISYDHLRMRNCDMPYPKISKPQETNLT
jgi:hypothetical protein